MSHSLPGLLRSPTRVKILDFLRTQQQEATVKELAEAFDLHPNVARTHVGKLVDAGLVVDGLRKQPKGGRPFRVYKAVADARIDDAVLSANRSTDTFGPATHPHHIDLFIELLHNVITLGNTEDVLMNAWSTARTIGQRATTTLAKPESGTLEELAQTMVQGLATYHPDIALQGATRDWADILNIYKIFQPIAQVDPDLAVAFERGIIIGAADGLGASIVLERPPETEEPRLDAWRITRSKSISTTTTKTTKIIDTRDLNIDQAVVTAMRVSTDLRPGDVLEVLTQNIGSPAAFARWADRAGHKVLAVERTQDHAGQPAIRLLIAKA